MTRRELSHNIVHIPKGVSPEDCDTRIPGGDRSLGRLHLALQQQRLQRRKCIRVK